MKEKKLVFNYIYNAAYQVLLMILPLITSPYISRVLAPEGIGIYSYTYSVVFYFGIFANLGISNYGNRLIAKCRHNAEQLNRYFSSVFMLHSCLSVVVIALYFAYVLLFTNEHQLISFLQSFYLLAVLIDISWFFFGMEEFKTTVSRNTIVKIVSTVLIFLLVKDKGDLWKYTTILVLSQFFGNLTLWMFIKRYVRFSRPSISEVLIHTKPMAILSISSIAVSAYLYIDKIMLGAISSMEEVGYYENAFKMIQFPLGLITAMGTVMLPHISSIIAKGEMVKAKNYLGNSMKIIALLSPPIAMGLASVSDVFSVVFWGREFAASGEILAVLSVVAMLISWNNIVRSEFLIPMEYDRYYVISVCMGAVVNMILNALAIPRFGGLGAAIGTIGAYTTVFAVQNWTTRKDLSHGRYFLYHLPFIIMSIMMYVAVRFVKRMVIPDFWGLVIMIATGVIVYACLALGYIVVSKDSFYMSYVSKLSRARKNGGKI